MRIIDWNKYTIQAALLIATFYIMDFTFLKEGSATIFFKYLIPLLFLLLSIHVTQLIIPMLKKNLTQRETFGSFTISLSQIMIINIWLTFINIFCLITKDIINIISFSPIPTYFFIAAFMGVGYLAILYIMTCIITKDKKTQ